MPSTRAPGTISRSLATAPALAIGSGSDDRNPLEALDIAQRGNPVRRPEPVVHHRSSAVVLSPVLAQSQSTGAPSISTTSLCS